MMPRRPVRFSLPGICARASDKGGPTPNFVSALRGQAEALPTAYVSELDDRTTRLGRATSYNMHGDGWSTCRRTRPWKVSPCMVSTSSRSSEGLGSRLLHVYTTHESSGRMRTALWAPVDIAPYTACGKRLGAEKRQVRARVR